MGMDSIEILVWRWFPRAFAGNDQARIVEIKVDVLGCLGTLLLVTRWR